MQNENIEVQQYFLPFVNCLLESFTSLNIPLVLAIDGSVVGKGCMCLMISLLYKNRALPLAWCVVKQPKGHMSEALHIDLLREVKAMVPDQKEVIVLGDGEFDGIFWLKEIEISGWQYVCRTAIDSILIEDGEKFNFKRLSTNGDDYFALPQVKFTHRGYGPLQAIFWKGKKHKAPICLVTNMFLAEEACAWYQKRFHIETFFSDQKSRGFNLHKSHLDDPERLHRLIIAAALAYIWIIYLGCLAMKEKLCFEIHRTDRCDYSLFRMGLKLLSYFMNKAKEIPVQFALLQFENPYVKKVSGSEC